MPVTTFTSLPSARWTPPITSICHSSIDRPRSHRRYSDRFRFRFAGSISPLRTSARYTDDRPGNGVTCSRPS